MLRETPASQPAGSDAEAKAGGSGGNKGGKKAMSFPPKIFLSDPKATALVCGELVPVKYGGWAVKEERGDYFTYFYVCVEGVWASNAGGKPMLTSVYKKDIGKKWKLYLPTSAPAWAAQIPDHF